MPEPDGLDNLGFQSWRLTMDVQGWKQRVEAERRQKDLFFASHPHSPIPWGDRELFKGLTYYPPDPEYRFAVRLHEYDAKEVIEVADTGGEQRRLWRWGELRFQAAGSRWALQAYKSDPAEQRLFVPFRDQTSGKETYAAGRYIDLEPARHLTEDGRWIVDFNQAYNPWCAYSDGYVCPFVPPENWLDVAIRAGEKNYTLAEK